MKTCTQEELMMTVGGYGGNECMADMTAAIASGAGIGATSGAIAGAGIGALPGAFVGAHFGAIGGGLKCVFSALAG